MDDKYVYIIFSLVQTAAAVVSVAAILYRQGLKEGRREQEIAETKRDINGLGEKVSNLRAEHNTLVTELRDKIDKVDKELAKISASMEFFKDAIKELKRG